jgi:flagellar capping protein FliD
VQELTEAFDALRALVSEEAGASRADDEEGARVREGLDRLAASLEGRRSNVGTRLADVGISLDDAGRLALDSEQLQGAIARDVASVADLLAAPRRGLASDVSRVFGAATSEPSDASRGLSGFLRGLTSAEARAQERIALLENVVVSLAGSAS